MAKPYPRKHTAIIFVVCLIIVAGTSFYVYGSPKIVTSQKMDFRSTDKVTPVTGLQNTASSQDWQKQFLDNSSNTAYKAPPKVIKTAEQETPLTATDLLGRNFFSKYLELRRSGQTENSQSVNQATNQIISQSLAGLAAPKAYTTKDIIIIATVDETLALKQYAEALISILKNGLPAKNEAEIAMNAFEKNDLTLLAGIDGIVDGYVSALNKLRTTPVPQSISQYHLDLINALSLQIYNAQGLRRAESDPVTALAAVGLEVKSLESIALALGRMQNVFAKAGITFVLPTSGSIIQ